MSFSQTEKSGSAPSAAARIAARFGIEPGEGSLAALAFSYFFLLLCGYYIIRPVRDNMGVEYGAARLPGLFVVIFLAMLVAVPLYGWVVSRFAKAHIVPIAYGFFGLQIVVFYVALRWPIDPARVAPYFFVWVSVYNLFVVSVFWSYLVDVFTPDQANRLFGIIAAGGTLGALVGPLITAVVVRHIGIANLLPLSFALLMAATGCVFVINRAVRRMPSRPAADERIGQGAFSGFRRVVSSRYLLLIALWVFLSDVVSTILYLEQQSIIGRTIAAADDRVHLFATMDFAVSLITILLQISLTAKIIAALGVVFAVALLPLLSLVAVAILACWPTLPVIVVCQVVGRGLNFGIANPARHILFATVSLDEKYKAQNVVDTLVERCGDAAGGTAFAALAGAAGLGLAAIAALTAPVAGLWLAVALGLGRARTQHLGRL